MGKEVFEGDSSPGDVHHDAEHTKPAESTEYNLAAQHDQLARGLKSRHIQFLALGKSNIHPSVTT